MKLIVYWYSAKWIHNKQGNAICIKPKVCEQDEKNQNYLNFYSCSL
jgi:hypothetical protein